MTDLEQLEADIFLTPRSRMLVTRRVVALAREMAAEILALRQIVRTGRWDEPEAVGEDVHSLRREVYENLRMIERLAAENKVLLQRLQQAGS